MGRYHHRDPGAYPDYATASSHAATTGNVLAQQVRIVDLFHERVLTQPCLQQKVERWIFAGVEVTGDGGLQKVVGWCHRELQILYGFMIPHRANSREVYCYV